MEAVAFQKIMDTPPSNASILRVKTPRFISWGDFQRRYLSREDGFKYEWLNGIIEKTERTMNSTQLFILKNLLAAFRRLLLTDKVHGELLPESDLFFLENHRRPDIAWLADQQIYALAQEGHRELSPFVIEVISNKDAYNKAIEKTENYRQAGVQVIWHIFPKHRQVHVQSGADLRQITVCKNEDLVSASPVLPGFEIPCSAIFKNPNGLN